MQVLGELLQLPAESDSIPLPWWVRAPLGLQSATHCHVALVSSDSRPVGDLIVSVLDPAKWRNTLYIKCQRADKPGVVLEAVGELLDTNIALAESVTTEAGTMHEITLACEYKDSPNPAKVKAALIERGFKVISVEPFPTRNVLWTRPAQVQGGWIHGTKWRDAIRDFFHKAPTFSRIDLTRAVISADSHYRLLRFVFPFKGVFAVQAETRDQPGMFKNVLDILLRHNLNLLSMLIRRGGAKHGNAVDIIICEPTEERIDISSVFKEIEEDIRRLPPDYRAEIELKEPLRAHQSISVLERNTIIARPPSNLLSEVHNLKRQLNPHKTPIFFSHRFVHDDHARVFATEVRNALVDNNCEPIESSLARDLFASVTLFEEVMSKMWLSKAAIVLITAIKGEPDPIGKNIPHELGFLQGQVKPILILVEGTADRELAHLWANVQGIYRAEIPAGEAAFNREQNNAIYNVVQQWMVTVEKHLTNPFLTIHPSGRV